MQLRDKSGGARATLELLRAMAPLCARAGVPLFANDRPDLALLARCDGVHLGQEDVPAAVARMLWVTEAGAEAEAGAGAGAEAGAGAGAGAGSRLRIGLSTHNAEDVEAALLEELDYIAVGPIFPTGSKDRPSPVVGLAALASFAARIREVRPGLPIVAIGGISLETAGEVGAVADCVAVIGALFPEREIDVEGSRSVALDLDAVRARARALHAAVLRGRA